MTTVGLKSRPLAAYQSIVSTPNWVGNLTWLTIAVLLQSVFIGHIALFGYGADVLERRGGHPSSNGVDIDPDRLGDYITRGIWPWVVQLVANLLLSIIAVLPIFGLLFGGIGIGAAAFGEEGAIFGVILTVPLAIMVSLALTACVAPFILRAMVTQDFSRAFDLAWARDFIRLMFVEMVLSGIVFALIAFGALILGVLACGVGAFVAGGLIGGASMHLLAQWYEIYLDRGGVPIAPPEDQVVDATLV